VQAVLWGVQNSKRKMVREKGCDAPYRNEMGRGSMMGRFCASVGARVRFGGFGDGLQFVRTWCRTRRLYVAVNVWLLDL